LVYHRIKRVETGTYIWQGYRLFAIPHKLLRLIFRIWIKPYKTIFGTISRLDHGQNRRKLIGHKV
jgi:hypothetical protein